jgi:tRNA pseudouridine32 synthase/23S rRNA pseudouridine746 synthase
MPPATPPDLPLRDGLSASCVVLPSTRQPQWPTLLDALAERLPSVTRADWQQRLDAGLVCNAHGQPLSANSPALGGQRIYYWRHVPDEPELPFAHQVLYQDEHLVVADKPHFVPVTPAGRYVRSSLLARLKRELELPHLSPIHRIDRETAGLVVFAVRPQDRAAYQSLFRERAVTKVYEALASLPADTTDPPWSGPHRPLVHRSRMVEDDTAFFRMREVAGEPNSETRVEFLNPLPHPAGGTVVLVRLHPLTGKRHQLRVHMAALGLPLLGDAFYPTVTRGPHEPDDWNYPLQLLARGVGFKDPLTGQARWFESQRALALG